MPLNICDCTMYTVSSFVYLCFVYYSREWWVDCVGPDKMLHHLEELIDICLRYATFYNVCIVIRVVYDTVGGEQEGHPACRIEWWYSGNGISYWGLAQVRISVGAAAASIISGCSTVQNGAAFWYQLTQVALGCCPLKVCVCVCIVIHIIVLELNFSRQSGVLFWVPL